MADDVERALEELVRRKVEEALRHHGIGSEKATEPVSPTPDLVQCPSCGYEFRPSESGSTKKGKGTSHDTSDTEGSAERSGSSRSRSVTSQSTTEGTTETETGTESVSGTSYME